MKKLIDLFIFTVIGTAACFAQPNKAIFYQSLAWSPDEKSLAFTAMSNYDEKTDEYLTGVFVINAVDGSGAQKISGAAKHASSPVWDKDGKRIFFSAETA